MMSLETNENNYQRQETQVWRHEELHDIEEPEEENMGALISYPFAGGLVAEIQQLPRGLGSKELLLKFFKYGKLTSPSGPITTKKVIRLDLASQHLVPKDMKWKVGA